MKRLLIVANWKMEKTHKESIDWLNSHLEILEDFKKRCKNTELIICPVFTALEKIGDLLQKNNYLCDISTSKNNSCEMSKNKDNFDLLTRENNFQISTGKDNKDNLCETSKTKSEFCIELGAQNCSNFLKGAYTGEISVNSLKELKCSYCIVGHSERRKFFGETDEMVAQKVQLLLEHEIIPIICIGESLQNHENGKTLEKLQKQLEKPLEIIRNSIDKNIIKTNICLAYEPWWAVGTNILPKPEELEKIFSWLNNYLDDIRTNKKLISFKTDSDKVTEKNLDSFDFKIKLLYGGSVNSSNIKNLKNIEFIDGFIIGKASLDLESIKKLCAD